MEVPPRLQTTTLISRFGVPRVVVISTPDVRAPSAFCVESVLLKASERVGHRPLSVALAMAAPPPFLLDGVIIDRLQVSEHKIVQDVRYLGTAVTSKR